MRFRLVTDATSEPVSIADMMSFARVSIDPSDGVMTALIKAARQRVERITGLALLNQTWVAVLDRWPDLSPPDYQSGSINGGLGWWSGIRQSAQALVVPNGMIEINKRPFQSVSQIQIRDVTSAFSTLDPTTYYSEVSENMGRISRKPGTIWPPIPANMLGAIEVTFLCGFGTTAAAVPADLLASIKMLVSHWHENREPISTSFVAPIPHHVDDILKSWTSIRLR